MLYRRALLQIQYLSGKRLTVPLLKRLQIGRSTESDIFVADQRDRLDKHVALIEYRHGRYWLIPATTPDAAEPMHFRRRYEIADLKLQLRPPRRLLTVLLLALLILGGVLTMGRRAVNANKQWRQLAFQQQLLQGVGYVQKAARIAEKMRRYEKERYEN